MTPFRAARATAAEAAGSRRSLTRTKFARSNHDRSASVSLLIIAPPEPFHGESKISIPPHTPATKILGESRGPFKKGSFGGCRAEPCLRPRHDTSTPINTNLKTPNKRPPTRLCRGAVAVINAFRQVEREARNRQPPAMRVGNKGYTKKSPNVVQ